jgi:hypothetical protein
MKLTEQLTDYVHAAFTGLWIQTHEPDEAQREILQHAQREKWRVALWDVAHGLQLPHHPDTPSQGAGAGDPLPALKALPALADSKGTALLILHNFHRFLKSRSRADDLCPARRRQAAA